MRTIRMTAAVVAALFILPATAMAVDYPPPTKPVSQPKPKGPFKALTVCPKKKKGCSYTKIQKAVNAAKPGDTVKVADGTYKEGVIIKKANQRYIKLVGNTKNPKKVRLVGTSLTGETAQNAVQINAVNGVTVDGFYATGYAGNGFFVVNVEDGYTFNHLIAERDGTYGVYAFNTKGGLIENSEANYNNDSGFYIGETPPQTKPKRSMVKNVVSWGNVLGFSGTNMKYVTITKSFWFNNGLGIVPNSLRSEKYAPPEDNVISDNDIFFNNYNYYAGAPFDLRGSATGTPYPIGTGILLFGGQRIQVTGNRVFGQNLIGVGALQQILLALDTSHPEITPEWYTLRGNQITGNTFNDGGKHPNGRDLFYDGNGTDNCVSGNIGVNVTVPADSNTFKPCPFVGNNVLDSAAQGEAINWALALDTSNPVSVEQFWKASSKTQPSVKLAGRTITAMEHYTK